MNDSDTRTLQEILQRTRRIETRVTKFSNAVGVPTAAQKATFVPAHRDVPPQLIIPSEHISLRDMIDSIPSDCASLTEVVLGVKVVAIIAREYAPPLTP